MLTFNKAEDLDTVASFFEEAIVLSGPHRYANRSALVFVQINSDASAEIGAKVKAVVDGL